ncbi:MAG: beta-galactosidase [Candidatus Omnitrophica bacterium]|nr:beta-galactosidase [Candidatus Omnitrophota bacterium]
MITSIPSRRRIRVSNKIFFAAILLFLSIGFCPGAEARDLKDKDLNMKSPFGVLEFLHWNHSWNNYKYPDRKSLEKAVALMKEAGVGWVRMDFLWSDIEPAPGKFQFERYDDIVELLSKNNIQVLGILHYSTDWASACGRWNCPPQDSKLFVNYAVTVASRYKEKVKYWEIWNEPDSSTYWQPQDGLKSYCVLLKEVYTALKKVDPGCKVLNGGLANGLSRVNALYDNGAKDYFDILNIHIFANPLHPGAIEAVTAYPRLAYKIMSRNGDAHKKIWVTEIGSPGVKEGQETKNWWMGDNPDEQKQAEWLEKVFTGLLKDKNVERVFWAFFRDCKGHWDDGVDYFGIVRWDFSKKPAFQTYQKIYQGYKKSMGE